MIWVIITVIWFWVAVIFGLALLSTTDRVEFAPVVSLVLLSTVAFGFLASISESLIRWALA